MLVCEGGVSVCGVGRGSGNRSDARKDGVEPRHERGAIISFQAAYCEVMSSICVSRRNVVSEQCGLYILGDLSSPAHFFLCEE
jgi:hypothetical protein